MVDLIKRYKWWLFGIIFLGGLASWIEPFGSRSREQSLAELDEAGLRRLFTLSQPSVNSPEAGYAP